MNKQASLVCLLGPQDDRLEADFELHGCSAELTCRFNLNSDPLHGHKPLGSLNAVLFAESASLDQLDRVNKAKWIVLFTSHDLDRENERVLRKVLDHRAKAS